MSYHLTTSEITLDTVAAVCLSTALDREIERVEKLVAKAKRPDSAHAGRSRQYLANLQRARAAFDPVYKEVLAAPMYTKEYEAVIDAALGREPRRLATYQEGLDFASQFLPE